MPSFFRGYEAAGSAALAPCPQSPLCLECLTTVSDADVCSQCGEDFCSRCAPECGICKRRLCGCSDLMWECVFPNCLAKFCYHCSPPGEFVCRVCGATACENCARICECPDCDSCFCQGCVEHFTDVCDGCQATTCAAHTPTYRCCDTKREHLEILDRRRGREE